MPGWPFAMIEAATFEQGLRPVTAELALRLGRALSQTPQYWLNLQSAYDLKIAQVAMKDSLLAVRALAAA